MLRGWGLLPLLLLWISPMTGRSEFRDTPLLVCLPAEGYAAGRLDSALGPALEPRPSLVLPRIRDLEELLPSYPGAPVLVHAAYVPYLGGYVPLLRGRKSESAGGSYLMVSMRSEVTPSDLASQRVGVLDFLGRKRMARFVEDAFGVKPAQLKRVGKKEDLLSLLGMEAVDAAVVRASDLEDMRRVTRARLFVVMESKAVDDSPVLAVPRQGDWQSLKAALGQSGPMRALGLEAWE